MMWFKACPKCKSGDLHLDKDSYGRFQRCVQCGYIRDLSLKPAPPAIPATPR